MSGVSKKEPGLVYYTPDDESPKSVNGVQSQRWDSKNPLPTKDTMVLVYKMFIREMTSKSFGLQKHDFFFEKTIIGCNPSITVFITHGHRIVW